MNGGCTTTALAYGGKAVTPALCHGASAVSNGVLPFTGVDLAVVFLAGLATVALGLLLRKLGALMQSTVTRDAVAIATLITILLVMGFWAALIITAAVLVLK